MSRRAVGSCMGRPLIDANRKAREVQGILCAKTLAQQPKKEKQKPRAVSHIPGHRFRSGDDRLRESNGRFAKDTVPKHKRAIRRKIKEENVRP